MNEVGGFIVPVFENIKRKNEFGSEYWLASDLQKVLEYSRWEKFKRVIKKAINACNKSGFNAHDNFRPLVHLVNMKSGGQRKVEDIQLTIFACYLIVQNADPSKETIALGQTYFAFQTRMQEISGDKGFSERAANMFWATQTDEKIKRECISGTNPIIRAHEIVRKNVRQTINDLARTIPDILTSPEEDNATTIAE